MSAKTHKAVVVMAKVPQAGRVKTRLCPPLGAETAAELYRALLLDVLQEVARCPEVAPFCCAAPQAELGWFEGVIPSSFTLIAQRGNTLGERMVHGFQDLFLRGFDEVVMRNSDSPTLPNEVLQEAFRRLHEPAVDAVFGPDLGGGYYLVGLKRPQPELFLDVTMSSQSMYSATLELARRNGHKVAELDPWLDVDTEADLRLLAQEIASGGEELRRRCPQTVATLAEIL